MFRFTCALVLPTLLLSTAASFAQTGFTIKTYPAVLSAASDNTRLISADLNNDGRPDLVTFGSRFTGSTVPGNVFLNDGHGGFLTPVALSGSGFLPAVKIGDMNGDGYPDIVGCMDVGTGANQVDSLTVYLNNGNGTFKALPAVTAQGQCSGLVLADINLSGHLSVVVVGSLPGQYGPDGTFYPGITSYIDLFTNPGTGVLSEQGAEGITGLLDDKATSTNYTNCGIVDGAGGDFLQTGKLELVLTTQCHPTGSQTPGYFGTTFLGQDADPTNPTNFSFTHIQSANQFYDNDKAVDMNGDSKLDVLSDSHQSSQGFGSLIYTKNTGNGSFVVSDLLDAFAVYGSGVGDFNGDGINDIAVAYTQGNPNSPVAQSIRILSGTASGTFSDSQDFTTGPATSLGGDVVVADFNGDGKPDIATLLYDTNARTTSLIIYTNTQSGTITPCPAPTAANTNIICAPAKGTTLNSPVTVSAASNVTGFTLNRLYLDNTSVYQVASQMVNTPVTVGNGTHTLVLVSYNNAGKAFSTSTTFTVGTSSPPPTGCLPSAAGVSICAPTAGSTAASPVTITAGALAQSGNITAIRAYIDNVAVFTTNNPTAAKSQQVSQSVTVAAGTHTLVVVGYEGTGGSLTSTESFTVGGSTACYPSSAGAQICSPAQNATTSSPVTVVAGATAGSGYITAVRVYVDNAAATLVNNPQQSKSFAINTPITIAAGKHSIVVVGYQSTGGSVSASDSVTVQ